ncbi:tol-pal system-associated acyl-CoA thioesterase [Acinetobacter apis]|uniref:Acyl-CoA thioester hydrolase n=1 Tax=Acinetobacter apis TaxID=1229165 RepID=A0A217EF03_9GAMM|nr:tol-pal system-associated acyl-CoA thioesterase [Acinetobacter apis]SNQ28934.1 acyl-CoA thioester hydrolase [Acinetobacter apis]
MTANTTHQAFNFKIRVYIEDTDAGGIVYHANHLRFMERARTEWLRVSGIDQYWHQTDYQFVVRHIGIKYLRPILMDDLIAVTARVISCKTASFILQQNIYRGEILLAAGEVELACLNQQLVPRKLPAEIITLIQKDMAQD